MSWDELTDAIKELLGVAAAEKNPCMHCVRTAWKEAVAAGKERLPSIRCRFPGAASTRCTQYVGRNDSCLPVSFLSLIRCSRFPSKSIPRLLLEWPETYVTYLS